jgi:hypothetical protein
LHTSNILRRYLPILLLTWLAHAPIAHSALISLQPDTGFAANGDSVSLDLIISDLGDFGPDSLGAFDIFVEFDRSVLSFTSYMLGGFLGDSGSGEAIDASGGAGGNAVNIAETSLLSTLDLDGLQPGSFTLATLTFNVTDLAVGETTQLSILPDAVLADAAGLRLPVNGGSSAVVEGRASVPVPGTLMLLLSALCGLRVVRRKHLANR